MTEFAQTRKFRRMKNPPLTTAQVAELRGVSVATVLRMIAAGTLAATKLPGKTGAYVMDPRDVDRAFAKRREASPASADPVANSA